MDCGFIVLWTQVRGKKNPSRRELDKLRIGTADQDALIIESLCNEGGTAPREAAVAACAGIATAGKGICEHERSVCQGVYAAITAFTDSAGSTP